MAGKPKVKMTQMANPFAHIDARKKAEEDAKIAAVAKRKQSQATVKKEVKSKSWMDVPFDTMRSVGDYLRGTQR